MFRHISQCDRKCGEAARMLFNEKDTSACVCALTLEPGGAVRPRNA